MFRADSFDTFLPLKDDLEDLGTRRGRFNRFLFHIKWLVCPIAVLSIPILLLVLLSGIGFWSDAETGTENTTVSKLLTLSVPVNDLPTKVQVTFQNGLLQIHGDDSKPIIRFTQGNPPNYFQYFDSFPGLDIALANLEPEVSISGLEVKWFKLDATVFSTQLGSLLPNLEILRLDNVTVTGFLAPVHLPKLREFVFKQVLENEQNLDQKYQFQNFRNVSDRTRYPLLDSYLFFTGNESIDFNSALRATSVNLSIWMDGTSILKWNPKNHEIMLSFRTCHPLLFPPTTPWESVVLGNCDDLEADSIPLTTKHLTLYLLDRNLLTTDLLRSMLRRLKNLEEFAIEEPWGHIVLDLAGFSSTLRLLSVSSVSIEISSSTADLPRFPRLASFYFGSSNQYKFVAENGIHTSLNLNFISNFNEIFPNIHDASIFELDSGRYTYLNVLLNSSVSEITVQGFSRGESPGEEEIRNGVEKILQEAGIPPLSQYFQLTRKDGFKMDGRSLTYEEQIESRFRMLGWSDFDSWNKYVYVRQLIDDGFYLG